MSETKTKPEKQPFSGKDWGIWGVRLALLIAAGLLGYWAQATVPPVVKLGPLGVRRWVAAAPAFRLYGWACLCFVLAALPSAVAIGLRPEKRHPILGVVLAALGVILLGFGFWGIYRLEPFLLGFPLIFSGFAALGIAIPCFLNPKPGRAETEEGESEREPEQKPENQTESDTDTTPASADEENETESTEKKASSKPLWLGLLPHILTWLGLLLALGAMIPWYGDVHRTWPFLLLIGGFIISGVGIYLSDRRRGVKFFSWEDRIRLWELPFLIAILAVAIGMRFYQLDMIPEGIWYDEADVGLEAREILKGAQYSPMGRFTNNPSLPFYVNAAFLYVLGDTLWALRCVMATAGVLGVIGIYLLARELFGRWAGIVASALLAAAFWHVNFSRFNMQNVLAPLAAIWMFYFVFRGVRNRRWLDFAIAGIVLGLGLHTYTGFRVIPPILLPLFVVGSLFQKGFLKQTFYPFVLMFFFSICAFGPLGVYSVKYWDRFSDRMSETSVFRDDGRSTQQKMEDFQKNIIEHYLMFHFWGDRNPRHGLSGAPKVDFVSGILMFLGLALAIYRWRDPRFFLLPVWLALALMGGILSLEWESPQTARTIAAIPVPFLMAAAALEQLRRQISRPAPTVGAVVFTLLVVPMLGYAMYLNYDIYFKQQMTRGDTWMEFSGRDSIVARYLLTLDENTVCYNQSGTTRQATYLIPQKPYVDRYFKIHKDLPPSDPVMNEQAVVYVLETWRVPLPERIWKHYFPQGKFEGHKILYGEPIFFTFKLSGEDINRAHGLKVLTGSESESDSHNELMSKGSIKRLPLHPDFLKERGVDSLPAEVRLSGIIYIPTSGQYDFDIQGGFTGEISINGATASDSVFPRLICGWNSLSIKGSWSGRAPLNLLWRKGGAGSFVPVPETQIYGLPLPDFGLLGYYYGNTEWQGLPAFRQIDPLPSFRWHPDPFTRHWSAHWKGELVIPEPGSYQFWLNSNDLAQLELDGEPIVRQNRNGWQSNRLTLDPGDVPLEMKYRQGTGYSELRLQWAPPGRGREFIDPKYLVPAEN